MHHLPRVREVVRSKVALGLTDVSFRGTASLGPPEVRIHAASCGPAKVNGSENRMSRAGYSSLFTSSGRLVLFVGPRRQAQAWRWSPSRVVKAMFSPLPSHLGSQSP